MNSKAFRRNHGPKTKSASSTFISLHFNKSDEDQLEISYKNDKKETEEVITKSALDVSQSNFYVMDAKKDPDVQPEEFSQEASNKNIKCSNLACDSAVKISKDCLNKLDTINCANDLIEKSTKSQLPRTQSSIDSESDLFKPIQTEDVNFEIHNATDLSPAIEAAEVVDGDTFNHYINDELEKAKCEILDLKREIPSSSISSSQSEKNLKNPFFTQHSPTDSKTSDQYKTDCSKTSLKSSSYFNHIVQKSISLMKYAQNSVKFHILIAVVAFICAPIPSWLSGFLVGTVLSSNLVYWLYKPAKNKRNFYPISYSPSPVVYTSYFQEESGILKGWMNELPSFMSYSSERYHVSCTRSVYVRLEGSYLRFSFPQKNIPKRAMFNEPRYEMQFVHQQHYDITDAIVELLPQGLNNKRLWSKKYPICLRIPNHKGAVLSQGSSAAEGSFSTKTNKKDQSNKKFVPRLNENNEIVIYLFSRTDRDKSLWFSRFLKASRTKIGRSHSPTLYSRISEHESLENKRTLSVDFASLQNSLLDIQGEDEVDDSFVKLDLSKQQKFEMYMSALLAPLHMEHPFALKKDKKDSADKKETKSQNSLIWLNVLLGRLFFDFLIEDIWARLVSEKIQKKLNRIKLPFFLAELTVKDIHLGSALPKVHSASDPCVDERGLWIDMDVSYNGSFHMTLETKLNLDRFKSDSETLFTASGQDQSDELSKSSVCDSDEDSLESSSDDECLFPESNVDGNLKEGSLPVSSSGSASKKLLKFMDKLAQSSYFQHAAKNKYVKKAMDDLSNTPLVLTVEVQWLTGTLAINIPPWPTDRLWYGFRTNPSLSITARPKLGQHAVTFTQVTEWIEKKLTLEFQKVLVMPNMDDLIIPIMQTTHDTS